MVGRYIWEHNNVDRPDLDGFTAHLRLKDTRDITIKRHLRCLKLVWENINGFTFEEIQTYLNNKKLTGTSNMTLRQYVSTIRMYAEFLGDAQLRTYSLKNFPRSQGTVRKTLPDSAIEALLLAPQRKWQSKESWKMWNCFWALLAFCALRPSEAKQLTKTDIDLLNKQIILRPEITKTNKFSTMPLFPNILPIVEEYVESISTEKLFPSLKGGEFITQSAWSDDFIYRLDYIGVKKVPGLVPYSLRHSCATRWINNDLSLYKVNRLMRHVKLEQTLDYTHMTSGNLVSSVMKFDPLVRKYASPIDLLEYAEESLDNYGLEKDSRFSEEFKKQLKDVFFEEAKRLRGLVSVFFIFLSYTTYTLYTHIQTIA